MKVHRLIPALLVALSALGQNGDRPGEAQPDVVPADRIPPAPVLDPEAAQRAFRPAAGFGVELVAAEPMVRSPVAMTFDLQGRLWVVEMSGYMNDVEGATETEPSGSVVILEDADGDGRMDHRTVFLDGLVMPRAILLTGDGAVIAEPPRLWFARDTNGDGRADEKVEIASDYATQNDPGLGELSNPEHASNGLLWARDNWVYSANHTGRMRWNGSPTRWSFGPTQFRGQWGLSQDDRGRLYFNSNSDQLRAELIPDTYLARNGNLQSPFGANVQLSKDQRVWTSRVNPGVNRGYQPGQLTPAGHLATFTGACGPVVYRGTSLARSTSAMSSCVNPPGTSSGGTGYSTIRACSPPPTLTSRRNSSPRTMSGSVRSTSTTGRTVRFTFSTCIAA